MKLYVTYDKVAEECSSVFEQKNDECAKRAFRNMISKANVNPDDYKLMYIGDFDNERCVIYDVDNCKEIYVEKWMEKELKE